MSYRITKQTQITDKRLAIEALKLAGVGYADQGDTLVLIGGKYNRAILNLSNGEISGDTDRHNEETLGLLRQYYGEAVARESLLKQGGFVQSRTIERIDGENCVVLYCRNG